MGDLRIDPEAVRQAAHLDGKYLIRTSDDTLSTEDVALGYKQLLMVESAFRTLKTTLDIRPMYHRKDERIRSHVLLCWLALLLVRIAEGPNGAHMVRHPLSHASDAPGDEEHAGRDCRAADRDDRGAAGDPASLEDQGTAEDPEGRTSGKRAVDTTRVIHRSHESASAMGLWDFV